MDTCRNWERKKIQNKCLCQYSKQEKHTNIIWVLTFRIPRTQKTGDQTLNGEIKKRSLTREHRGLYYDLGNPPGKDFKLCTPEKVLLKLC